MVQEKVSIILPTYNRAYILEKSIASVLNQTYPEFELLLIDDGSTDQTKELIEAFGDKRIRYFYSNLNQGVAVARNIGIEKAECNYIAFEDSDDIWYSDKLEKQMELLVHADPAVGFVYHKIRYNMGGNRYAVLPAEQIPTAQKNGNIYEQMLYDNLVPCPSILAKRECVFDAGKFDTQMKALEDYDFALKMARCYQGLFLDEVLLEASYSTDGVSGNAVNYLLGSCYLVQKYKNDYLKTNTLNHRLEIILRDAAAIGMQEQFVGLLEQIMKMGEKS